MTDNLTPQQAEIEIGYLRRWRHLAMPCLMDERSRIVRKVVHDPDCAPAFRERLDLLDYLIDGSPLPVSAEGAASGAAAGAPLSEGHPEGEAEGGEE